MEPLRIGIIGCGDITRAHLWGYWTQAQAGLADFEIAALCSRTKPKSEQYVGRHLKGEIPAEFAFDASPRVRSYKAGAIGVGDLPQSSPPDYHADWRELIARDDLDAVEIHLPPAMHHTVALEALRAGKHVFLEKPMTVTVRGAHQVAEAARETGLRVAVGTNYCFDPGPRAAEWLLQSGRLGRVRIFHSKTLRGPGHWTRPVGSKLRSAWHSVRDKILYRRPGAVAAPMGPKWRYQKTQVGAGEVVENGVHLLDVAHHLCGPIDRAFGVLQSLEVLEIEQPDGSVGQSEQLPPDKLQLLAGAAGVGVEGDHSTILAEHRGERVDPRPAGCREHLVEDGAAVVVAPGRHDRQQPAVGGQGELVMIQPRLPLPPRTPGGDVVTAVHQREHTVGLRRQIPHPQVDPAAIQGIGPGIPARQEGEPPAVRCCGEEVEGPAPFRLVGHHQVVAGPGLQAGDPGMVIERTPDPLQNLPFRHGIGAFGVGNRAAFVGCEIVAGILPPEVHPVPGAGIPGGPGHDGLGAGIPQPQDADVPGGHPFRGVHRAEGVPGLLEVGGPAGLLGQPLRRPGPGVLAEASSGN